ncbi:uncharacterized protein with WD repeat [Anaerosolibacter carboniphilus]|uniref:Uncharacterized protein with WD repeat n=1 Tax=Anaerosolibacter carboniphilus TaxID=1417629 RepID=A0A841KUK3_9FIRM|nr:hypothetical protein [Anaerosolibacter carboniphilus]MBB6217121.1 uncharacterized protein with WD repeat [Anaerosolibacter carboniphilus]
MRKNLSQMNKKLAQAAGNIQPTEDQMKQFANLANQYGGMSPEQMEKEMKKLAQGFSEKEKKDMIQKLHMLKQMSGLLDNDQRRKVDKFIELLSK